MTSLFSTMDVFMTGGFLIFRLLCFTNFNFLYGNSSVIYFDLFRFLPIMKDAEEP